MEIVGQVQFGIEEKHQTFFKDISLLYGAGKLY